MRRGFSKLSERLAFVHIPDATQNDLTLLVSQLKALKLDLPYRLAFIGGKDWKTISKDEFIEIVKSIDGEGKVLMSE